MTALATLVAPALGPDASARADAVIQDMLRPPRRRELGPVPHADDARAAPPMPT